MTLDRDVRLTADEINELRRAARAAINSAARSIATAEANRAAGHPIQAGTLQRHYERLGTLAAAAEKLEAARRALGRRIADQLEGAPQL